MKRKDFLSPENAISYFLKETPFSLRNLQLKSGINKSRLCDLRNQRGKALTVNEAVLLSDAMQIPRSALFPADLSLSLSSETSDVAHKLGKAISSAIRQQVDVFGHILSTDAIESWYFATGGKLVEMPDITPHLTLYKAPSSTTNLPQVVTVGERSMTADRIGRDVDKVQRYIEYLAEAKPETIESYHSLMDESGIKTFYRAVAFRNTEVPYLVRYKTILMAVSDNSERFIWNFSKCVCARPATELELADPAIPEGV